MTTIAMEKARQEFLVFLRNSDILSTTQRGVTTKTDKFVATAGQTVFTLSSFTVRNVRSVLVNSVAKLPYKDYNPAYNQGIASTITFLSGLTLSDTVDIQYDYSSGTAEKVWPDYPEVLFLPTNCPRVGFDFISMRTTPIGIGATNWLTDALVRVKFYDLGTYKTIDQFISTLRSKLKAAQKSFYHFQIAYVTDLSPVNITLNVANIGKVFERFVDITMRFAFES